MAAKKKDAMWEGNLCTLCQGVLKAFEKTQANMDNLIYKRTFEKDTSQQTKQQTKLVQVQMKTTDRDVAIRKRVDWTGPENKKAGKETENLHALYWGIRTERQDLLLSEIVFRVFSKLAEKGYTHVGHAIDDKKYKIPISSFKPQTYAIVPHTTIQSFRPTGGWEAPDDKGVFHHIVVGTAEDGTKIAVDVGYAQYYPSSLKAADSTNGNEIPLKISEEKDLLNHIAASFKLVRDTSDVEVAKKNPLFKQKVETFFALFSVDSTKLKETGNAEFEKHNYEDSLLWYSLGIECEKDNKKSELAHILYSNRSTAYYQLKQYELALDDANTAISLAPKWPKGYFRKNAALEALDRHKEAKAVLEKMHALEEEAEKPVQPKKKKLKTEK